jgi:nitroreductase
LSAAPAVFHYAADRHALELRCTFDQNAWGAACAGRPGNVLVALTSIHWRESWKYGERAFRYCQHDLGHAIAALALAARIVGWHARLLPGWSHDQIAAITGVDRHDDFSEGEREEPACLMAFAAPDVGAHLFDDPGPLVAAVRGGRWTGRASRLSQDNVQWPLIDEIVAATRDPGRHVPQAAEGSTPRGSASAMPRASCALDARQIVVQRRSAVALDGRSSIGRDLFFSMLARVMPGPHAPWGALWWTPCVHLVLFVHRVDDVGPGLYVLVREALESDGEPSRLAAGSNGGPLEKLRAAFGRDFLWVPAHDALPLVLLAEGNCTRLAERLSCDQEIASHGYFSFGMIAAFDPSLEKHGPSFYRHLFWETGVIGQVMYLEAEAAGSRATGIGCFYDDPVHDALGLRGHEFQSLYHFTVGTPVEDPRLTTEPGYSWEPRREPADARAPEAAGVAGSARER